MEEQSFAQEALITGALSTDFIGDDSPTPPTPEITAESNKDRLRLSLVIEEYIALRNEIQKRIEIRQQIITLTLLVAGTFLTVGVQTSVPKSLPLIYPILALFLAVGWTQQDLRIGLISDYICQILEPFMQPYTHGWENYRKRYVLAKNVSRRQKRRQGADPDQQGRLTPQNSFSTLLSRGVFITSQSLALAIAGVRYFLVTLQPGFQYNISDLNNLGVTVVDPLLFLIDFGVIIATFFVLRHYRRPTETPQVPTHIVPNGGLSK